MKRDLDSTKPVCALPANSDPIWLLGHEVVAAIAAYLDAPRPKRRTLQGLIAPERGLYPGVGL